MKNTEFTGAATSVVTQLNNNGVDYEEYQRLIEWQISEGIDAIVVAGTTGEGSTLTDEEHRQVLKFAVDKIAGRVPVIAGTGSNDTSYAIDLTKYACSIGADAMLVVTPYYNKATQNGLIKTFTAIADASTKPVILYNVPSRTGCNILPKTCAVLAEHPNIVGLKDSSANMTYFQTLLYHLGDREDFALYVGPVELTGESVVMGADGGVNGGANIFPELYVQMYYAACNRDVNTMRALFFFIFKLSTEIYTVGKYGSSYLKGVKCSLSLMGICDDYMSYPYRRFRTEERARIRKALEALGTACGE